MNTKRLVFVAGRVIGAGLLALVATVFGGLPDRTLAGTAPGSTLQAFVESNSVPFSIDVWTDTGGQGLSMSAGTYGPDDEVMVYVSATADCLASASVGLLSGEIYALIDASLEAGETAQLPSIPLYEIDSPEGTWVIQINAIAGEARASDNVKFNVAQGAGSSAQLTVDVMTDRGGRGTGVPDGTYCIGTQTVITIELSMEADVTLSLQGPGVNTSDDGRLQPGTHTVDLGVAEEGDEGVWVVEIVAWAGGQQASDSVQFSVLPNDLWSGVAITPSNATTLDALIALKMSFGHIDEDPVFDVDRDGSITAADANLILLWSVSQ